MRAADIDRSFTPRRADSAYTVELDGEAVVLDEARNRLHHLNPTASLVWSCFDGTGTISQIADDLAESFASAPDEVTRDLLALAQQLGTEGLLDGVEHEEPE